jgi:Zn-dependent protease with chaperone function
VNRDHLAALQNSMRESALGGFSDYVGGNGGLGGAFKTALLNAGKDLFTRGLNKEDEFAADRMGVVIAARSGYSPYGLVGVLQTLSAAPDEKGFALMNKTHPLPVERLDRLDRAMGTRFDAVSGLVDDLPSFTQLRAPPAPERPAPAQPRRGRRKS